MNFKYRAGVAKIKGLVLIVLVGVIVGCDSSDPIVSEPPEPTVAERLQDVLDQAVSDGLPGAGVAVKGATIDFAGVAGVEDITTAVPLTNNHRFYLASVGKTYTAVAIVRMAADGLLNLDDPITLWLPAGISERIPSGNAITIRSLLNHTSGIFDYQDDADEWLFDAFLPDPNRHWTNTDVLPFFLDRPLHFEPMTSTRYADSNYVLAGLIAEKASGQPVQDVIRNYILAPLGLQRTVHGFETQGLPDFVHGYVDFDGDLLDVYPWYSHYGVSDGGIQASASDLATFVHEVLAGGAILNDAMRTELLTPSGFRNSPTGSGLGIDITFDDTSEVIDYWNAGQDAGSRAEFHHITAYGESLTIAYCASASLGDYEALFQQMKQAVRDVLIDADVMPGPRP